MPRKRVFRTSGDVREHPRYSVQEAAEYLHIPASTLKAWIRGQDYFDKRSGKRRVFKPIIEAADSANKLLSFYNLAEAHLLRSTIEADVPLASLRKALDYLRQNVGGRHPLLRKDLTAHDRKLFLTELGQTINITEPQGNLFMQSIFDEYLLRLKWSEADLMPFLIYPIRTQRLVINPLISSGKPVIKGTGIMVSVLRDRAKRESISELADDYGLKEFEIEEALKEFAAA